MKPSTHLDKPLLFRFLPRRIFFPLLALLLLGSFAGMQYLQEQGLTESVQQVLSNKLATQTAAAKVSVDGYRLKRSKQIFQLYKDAGFAPVWISDNGMNPQIKQVIETLGRASDEGLEAMDYNYGIIAKYYNDLQSGKGKTDPDSLAAMDMLLSDAFIAYGSDLYAGAIQGSRMNVARSQHLAKVNLRDTVLRSVAENRAASALASLTNQRLPYKRLKEQLALYRFIGTKGGFPTIPDTASMKPGKPHESLPDLCRRLALAGELKADYTTKTYDPTVMAAVSSFQEANGLEVNGLVNWETKMALNRPVYDRIRQIELNMERWRWLPRDEPDEYLLLNIPAFTLEIRTDTDVKMHMRAIVGTEYNRTPTFHAYVTYVVINPYWDVPRSIATKEILPILKRNPGYLAKNHMLLYHTNGLIDPYSVNWSNYSKANFPFRIRQKPGPWNALGELKLIFPNPYNVYLHGTPYQKLFDKRVRTFSHGCMRIEDPIGAAAHVLRHQSGWSESSIRQAVARGSEKIVVLKRPAPVYISYLTAWVDESGRLNFRPDVYGHDNLLADAFFGEQVNYGSAF